MVAYTCKTFSVDKPRYHIVFLCGWNLPWWVYLPIIKLLQYSNYSLIVFSYGSEILVPDPEKTSENFHFMRDEIMRICLKKKLLNKDTILLGVSLGSILGSMILSKTDRVKKAFFVTCGYSSADIVWSWKNLIPVFSAYYTKHKINLVSLREKWKHISPGFLLSDKKNISCVFIYSEKDEAIPMDQSIRFKKMMNKKNVLFTAVKNYPHVVACALALLQSRKYLSILED